MKFYLHSLRIGDTREITKFAWFPIRVFNMIYWLERVTIRQTYLGNDRWRNDYIISKSTEESKGK